MESVIRRRRARGDEIQEDFESALSSLASREVQQRERFCSGIQLVIASVARLDSKRGARLLHPELPPHHFPDFRNDG